MLDAGKVDQNQPMKRKAITLDELPESWWWNRAETLGEVARQIDWPVVEESARNYELLRRSPNGKQFGKTYLELIPDEKRIVHGLWATWKLGAYRPVWNPKLFHETGWTPVDGQYQHRQWNLRMADKYLIEEFIREIRLYRQFQKIPTPHPNKGKKHRGISWKLVEVLDRKLNGIGKFDDGERHMLTDAKRRAEKYCAQYENALDQWKNNPNPDFIIEEPDDSDETGWSGVSF